MGAGERSYLVRNDQIDVLKNVYGGVQVSQRAWVKELAEMQGCKDCFDSCLSGTPLFRA